MLEFQKIRIEALEKEVERLKVKLIETEKSTSKTSKDLREFINDPIFNKPIQITDYRK